MILKNFQVIYLTSITSNAVPLYVQALSLLMPPKEKREREPNVDERCRGQ